MIDMKTINKHMWKNSDKSRT
ncbi:hypothetical protein CP8484711_1506A, partial [Chlamydia psittaci 84-8471/1]